MNELTNKLQRLRELADRSGLEAILLQRTSSVAWATSGASVYINTASSNAEASLLITKNKQFLVANNIEAVRFDKEEGLAAQGWIFQTAPWFEKNTCVSELTQGLKLGSDGLFPGACDLSADIAHLRADLGPYEGERFRTLGRLCAQAMDAAVRAVRPGQTEFEIAGLLSGESERRGVQPTVILIATDERIFNYRHPLPTSKKLERYAMLILCGRRQGLVCSITRLVHFGRLPDDIQRKAEAVARIDAAMIAASRPGNSLASVFQTALRGYAEAGYPEEWRLHHQGGPAGYEPREYVATPSSPELVKAGQVYAWNPTITGSKSEDSVLVGEKGNEILTAIPGWPTIPVDLNGQTLERPAILVVE
ncbi:MAG TPA: M24 family metallopeptidase [Anaerolineales bacterium]|nr:M24 family metallopeptidase [Anaerolineales bacterium]